MNREPRRPDPSGPPRAALVIERVVLLGLLLVCVLMLFRPTQWVGATLGVLWIGLAFPAAWLWERLDDAGAETPRGPLALEV